MLFSFDKKPLILLLTFSLLIALARGYAYGQPLFVDLPLYSLIADGLLNGQNLYQDFWDHKPPAIYLIFALAQWLVGFGEPAIFILASVTSIISLFGVYVVASRWGKEPVAGLWAAAFWTFASGDLLLQGQKPNGEAFMNACMIWSLALYLKPGGWDKLSSTSIYQGILFFLASWFKPFTVIFAAFLSAVHVVLPTDGDSSKAMRLRQVLLIIAFGIFFWSLNLLYFWINGRFEAFWEAVVIYNQHYAGDMLFNLKEGLHWEKLIPPEMKNIYPLLAVSLVGLIFSNKLFSTRERSLYLAYAFSVFFMIALPGQFFPHYYQLWLPLLCVLGARSVMGLMTLIKPDQPVLARYAALALFLLVAGSQLPSFALSKDEWAQISYTKQVHFKRSAGRILKNTLKSDERMFVWGWDPDLYYFAGIKPVSRFLIVLPLDMGPFKDRFSKELLLELKAKQPELLVISPWRPQNHPLIKELKKGYEPFPHSKMLAPYEFYYLKGSALEKRLLAS